MNGTVKVAVTVFCVVFLYLAIHLTNQYMGPPSEGQCICQCEQGNTVFSPHPGRLRMLSASTVKPAKPHKPYQPIIPVVPEDSIEPLPNYNHSFNTTSSDWWKAAGYMERDFRKRPEDYACKTRRKRGNWPVCMDGVFDIKPPCLVYSFGIAFDFSFDDAMAALGCEVHSFDPSMKTSSHIRKSGVFFHDLGLSGINNENFTARRDVYVTDQQQWTLLTLGTIMAAYGHKKRVLDVLKIDIEGHEWAVIDYLLRTGLLPQIKQFLLEYHMFPKWPDKKLYPKFLADYKELKDAGFAKFFTSLYGINHNPERFNIQADVCYVNKNFMNT